MKKVLILLSLMFSVFAGNANKRDIKLNEIDPGKLRELVGEIPHVVYDDENMTLEFKLSDDVSIVFYDENGEIVESYDMIKGNTTLSISEAIHIIVIKTSSGKTYEGFIY